MESFSRRIEQRPSSSALGRLLDDPVNDSVEPALVECMTAFDPKLEDGTCGHPGHYAVRVARVRVPGPRDDKCWPRADSGQEVVRFKLRCKTRHNLEHGPKAWNASPISPATSLFPRWNSPAC